MELRWTSGNRISAMAGLTFIELVLVITLIGLILAIAIPNSVRARDEARLKFIYNNLRRIEVAKSRYALENHVTNGAPVELDSLTNYFRGGVVPEVIHETYFPSAIGTPARAALPKGVPLGPYRPGSEIPAPVVPK